MKCPNCGLQHYRINNARKIDKHTNPNHVEMIRLECTCIGCGHNFSYDVEAQISTAYNDDDYKDIQL